MWSPSESSNINDRRAPQRSRHQELQQRNFTTSNLVDASRQKDFRYDREDIYSSTSASTSAAVLSPPRRSLSYEDRLSAMTYTSSPITASNTPIPSPSTLRTHRPLGSKRSNLAASTPASPSIPSPTSRFAQSNSDNALGPTPLRSPMFSETTSSSRRPSSGNNNNVTGSSRRSSAARSPDSAAAALAASKYDMKRMLSKPAPMSSSLGSSSAGSAGILSSASRAEDDVFGYHQQQSSPQQHQDIDPLAYSSSVDTSRSHLKNANPDIWPSDTPALLGAGAGGKTYPDSVSPLANTFNSTATRTRSRNESSTSTSAAQSQPSQQHQQQPLYHNTSSSSRNQQQPQPHRARALTQTSSMTATTTTSSSVVFPPGSNLSHSNSTSYYADHSVDSHSYANSTAASSRSRIPPMPGGSAIAFPISSDDVGGGSFLSGSGSGPGAGPAKSSASPAPTRALTPASAIAYAYQQQQQLRGGAREFDSSRPSPSPSPNPSFYTASSSSASESGRAYGGDSEYYQHQQYLNTPFGSARTLGGGGGSPISPNSGRVVSNGDPESGNVEKSRSSGALRTLGRKVSGKFSRKSSGGLTTSGRRGTIAAGAEDVINVGGVGSSVSTNEGSYLAQSSEFGGYDGDDSTGGGKGSAPAPGMAFSASSSSRGGSGRSRSQYDVSQRRSPSGYFGDASGTAGLADVSSSSIDASLPTSPVSPAAAQQQQQSMSDRRPSKLTKTKSLLRLSQQGRSVTDPTPVPEPPTPSSTSVGTSIWRMVKKFSSSTLREKHRTSASPVEAVPPVPALPPGVVNSASASRRSSVSDDYGIVVGGGAGAFGGGFGRDEGGARFSISSAVSRPKSEAKRSMIGRSRSGTVVSSAQSHGHGVPFQNRGAPPPDLPRSGPRSPRHEHNRSLSQSRTTTATLSSSPISSDLSSSKCFFGRQQSSPRTSTSSYLAYSDTQDYGPPPPLPVSQKQQQAPSAPQHIMPPDEIAAMLREYGDDLGGIVVNAKEDDDGSSSNYHNPYAYAPSRKSFASSAAPQKGSGLSAPPSSRSTDRSRSRDPPSSRKSSTSGKGDPPSGQGDLQERNPAASMSSSSLSMAPAAKPTKPKKVGNFQHPPLNMLRKSAGNPAASRYVAVQGGGETSPSSVGPKTSPAKKTVLHRLMRSKSEVNLTPTPSTANPPTPPTARPPPPPPTTTAAESKERRRTSPPMPSPSSPTKRWSIDERRGSAGSGNLLNPPSAPLSPTRAASFDLQRSRPSSFSTTVMFRDLTEAQAVKRSEDEKNKMWDMLLEKSEKAGGTLHAKIDSSFY